MRWRPSPDGLRAEGRRPPERGEKEAMGINDKRTGVPTESEKRAAEKAARVRAAREAWVSEHGSTRLRKALDAGLLEQSATVYREERLAFERPGWVGLGARDEVSEIHNPSEAALDVLFGVREIFRSARLVSVRHAEDPRAWREAVSVSDPFGPDDLPPRAALRFVHPDEKLGPDVWDDEGSRCP